VQNKQRSIRHPIPSPSTHRVTDSHPVTHGVAGADTDAARSRASSARLAARRRWRALRKCASNMPFRPPPRIVASRRNPIPSPRNRSDRPTDWIDCYRTVGVSVSDGPFANWVNGMCGTMSIDGTALRVLRSNSIGLSATICMRVRCRNRANKSRSWKSRRNLGDYRFGYVA